MAEKLIVSVSGIRGIYGRSLTENDAFEFGAAFGSWCGHRKVLAAADTRPSGKFLKEAHGRGLASTGKTVLDLGIAPTPAVGFLVEKNPGFNGTIVTASHNPQEYNGIKFFADSGAFLDEKELAALLRIHSGKKFLQGPGVVVPAGEKINAYFAALPELVNVKKIRKKRFKVVIDPCQGVGAVYTRAFLQTFGCETAAINEQPLGEFSRNPEPRPENLAGLAKKVIEEKAALGISQDPDGDRLALVDERGNPVSEEYGVALIVRHILETRKKGPVVVNLSTTMLLDDVCKEFNVPLFRTRTGELHVASKMKEVNAAAGGEGNGGIIFPEFHYGRDSFAGIALLLECLSLNDLPLSKLVGRFPGYHFLKEKWAMPPEKAERLKKNLKNRFKNKNADFNEEDGLKIILPDMWFSLRKSGTEPVIRFLAEGKNRRELMKLKAVVSSLISCNRGA